MPYLCGLWRFANAYIFLYIRGYYRSFMKDINPDLFPQFILRDKNIKEIGEVEW